MKPILFSIPMVQAILDGRKTMTRRVAKELGGVDMLNCRYVDGDIQEPIGYPGGHMSVTRRSRIQPGDTLWVRETVREFSGMYYVWQGGAYIPGFDFSGWNYRADDAHLRSDDGEWSEMLILSDDSRNDVNYAKWLPSIHMPKAAARIFLRVTDVRAERVQEISHKDALLEGIEECHGYNPALEETCDCVLLKFSQLWDSLYAEQGYGWDKNPWVWVISFERISKQEAEEGDSEG